MQLLKSLDPNNGKLLQASEGGDVVSWKGGKKKVTSNKSNLIL